ncbi:MAG: ester cyclase [Caldilineaceae bacterium]|jgi:steroid delta-isomerase-like uncharacterized protein
MAENDEHKELVRRYADDVLTHQRYDLLEQYITPDFVDHFGRDIEGPIALTVQMEAMHKSFGDLTFHVVHIVAEDDIVAVHFRVPGIHRDEFSGIPATGCAVEWKGAMFYRIAGNRIAEGWGYWNVMEIVTTVRTAAADADGSER